jgi:hypothetical protein
MSCFTKALDEKSKGVKSGDLGGQGHGLLRPVHFPR